ncbi:NADP-dependent oxidoreductase domain [Pseudocohnilembus persalinus]|uniref:NADP-dependent oxidoreductase domain n=1 Tax=Pseudocohnilembus persalinus TaxID=266149 RepID=A0A0V0R2K8_PSEPJ|nr:NADP-dependent oxidoreductase domain [Pseudocohnilembus persalinus]|eukprot:KRX08570.1 NADP-dependent oxidoreductase domain [Pseudocohnilembus persalinus]
MATKLAQTKKLNSGHEIPIIGLGFFKTELEVEDYYNLIKEALDQGYRHLDTAIRYNNEEQIGKALKKIFQEGKYKREDLFITSKVFPNMGDIKTNIKESLQRLQLEYLDLYLLHWPAFGMQDGKFSHRPVHVLYPELESCVEEKLTKSIGVSNFNVQSLLDLLAYCKIKPVTNQVEINIYLQQPRLIEFCNKFGIEVTSYRSLVNGGEIFQEPTLVRLAEKYKKTVAQILLNFTCFELGVIVIPKTQKPQRLSENFQWQDFRLEKEDVEILKKMDKNQRTIDPYFIPFFSHFPLFD